jgi:hypothetical protein
MSATMLAAETCARISLNLKGTFFYANQNMLGALFATLQVSMFISPTRAPEVAQFGTNN